MQKIIIRLAPLLFILLVAVACSRDGAVVVGKGNGSGGPSPAGLSVWIIPDAPTAADELLAVVSGIDGGVYYRWEVNGQRVQGATTERFAPGPGAKEDSGGQLSPGDRVTVTVGSGGQTSSGTIMIRNAPPVIVGLKLLPDPPRVGSGITVVPKAEDPDNDHVRFGVRWFVNGEEVLAGHGPKLPTGAFRRGDEISVKVTPSDGVDFGRTVTATVTVPNAAPEFTSTPSQVFKGLRYSYRARAEDPDGDKITYSLLHGPTGMEMAPGGLITWRPGPGDEGVHRVELAATDAMGQRATQTYEIAVGMSGR